MLRIQSAISRCSNQSGLRQHAQARSEAFPGKTVQPPLQPPFLGTHSQMIVLRGLTALCRFSSIPLNRRGRGAGVVVRLSNPSRQAPKRTALASSCYPHFFERVLKGASYLWLNLKGKEPSVDALLMLLSTVRFAGDASILSQPYSFF